MNVGAAATPSCGLSRLVSLFVYQKTEDMDKYPSVPDTLSETLMMMFDGSVPCGTLSNGLSMLIRLDVRVMSFVSCLRWYVDFVTKTISSFGCPSLMIHGPCGVSFFRSTSMVVSFVFAALTTPEDACSVWNHLICVDRGKMVPVYGFESVKVLVVSLYAETGRCTCVLVCSLGSMIIVVGVFGPCPTYSSLS